MRQLALLLPCVLLACSAGPPPPPAPPLAEPSSAPPPPPPPASATAAEPKASAAPPAPEPPKYPPLVFPKSAKTYLPDHGQKAWAVYLATFENTGPEFTAASNAWVGSGLAISSGDIECDEGAQGKVPGKHAVRTYLKTEAEAKAFAKETKPEPVGVVQVKVRCAD